MIPSIITIISGNLSQNSGGYNSDIIGIRDIICFSNKSGILPGTYFVTSHHMFSIISGILGIFSHSVVHQFQPPILYKADQQSTTTTAIVLVGVLSHHASSLPPPSPLPTIYSSDVNYGRQSRRLYLRQTRLRRHASRPSCQSRCTKHQRRR